MGKARLEAFNDAIVAIIMTIMVLQLVNPSGKDLKSLWDMKMQFAIYFISFFSVAVYWINHHHMMFLVDKVTGVVLWTDIGMLFFMSFTPFAISWMVESGSGSLVPAMFYGTVFLIVDISFGCVFLALKKAHGQDTKFHMAYGENERMLTCIILGFIVLLIGYFSVKAIFIGRLLISVMWVTSSGYIQACMEDEDLCQCVNPPKRKGLFK